MKTPTTNLTHPHPSHPETARQPVRRAGIDTPLLILSGWTIHDGANQVKCRTAYTLDEALMEYVHNMLPIKKPRDSPMLIRAWRHAITVDGDRTRAIAVDEQRVTIDHSQITPPCLSGKDHHWTEPDCPVDDNTPKPAVWAFEDRLVEHQCCTHCGIYREIDFMLLSMRTHTSVEYADPDTSSLRWILRNALMDKERGLSCTERQALRWAVEKVTQCSAADAFTHVDLNDHYAGAEDLGSLMDLLDQVMRLYPAACALDDDITVEQVTHDAFLYPSILATTRLPDDTLQARIGPGFHVETIRDFPHFVMIAAR